MTTVVGMFDNATAAQAALNDLKSAGFTGSDIDFIANNTRGDYGTVTNKPGVFDKEGDGLDAGEGAAFGATSGAIIGLLVGLGALAIPGVGPVIAAGALGATLTSTVVGAASGGIIGALVGAGIPESDAHIYAEGLRRGGSMVVVRSGSEARAQQAITVMQRHGVVDIDRRADAYRQEGWSGFDNNAPAYSGTTDEGIIERNASKAGNALERGVGADLDRDGDVGVRDTRNNIGPRVYSSYNAGEGAIERNASKLGNAVERGLNTDIDNDGDVGRRDTRNNI